MRCLLILFALQVVWGAHDDFRVNRKQRTVSYDVNRYYKKLSSVMEFSPKYRWKHLNRSVDYNDYRSNKYLNKNFLPFHYDNSYYRGMHKKSPELYELRPYPPYTRTLRIEMPFCDNFCKQMKSGSPFIFD